MQARRYHHDAANRSRVQSRCVLAGVRQARTRRMVGARTLCAGPNDTAPQRSARAPMDLTHRLDRARKRPTWPGLYRTAGARDGTREAALQTVHITSLFAR
jgi:hypothetical protein